MLRYEVSGLGHPKGQDRKNNSTQGEGVTCRDRADWDSGNKDRKERRRKR